MKKVAVIMGSDSDLPIGEKGIAVLKEDGRRFEVDRLLDVRRAAATRAGGQGMRYTVRIMGRETYLFEDDDRWFVEAKGNVRC